MYFRMNQKVLKAFKNQMSNLNNLNTDQEKYRTLIEKSDWVWALEESRGRIDDLQESPNEEEMIF